MEDTEIKLEITSYEEKILASESKPFIDYCIQITKENISWTVEKRYNELLALHNWIIRNNIIDISSLPPFPEAPFFDTRDIKEVAAERKGPLQKYLSYLFTVPELIRLDSFKIFFEVYRSNPGQKIRKTVVMPLPEHDFDLTETAVTWKILKANGIKVVFASEAGAVAIANPLQLQKPGLTTVAVLLPAFEARRYYMEMEKDQSFQQPIPYAEIVPDRCVGMVLVGGNSTNLKHYLECKILQSKVQEFWALKRPIGAIGQGVLIMARTTDPTTKQPLIHSKKTTCYPKIAEMIGKYNPFTGANIYVESSEEEILRSLSDPSLFQPQQPSLTLDTLFSESNGYCQDEWYLSSGWEGDSYCFAKMFAKMVIDCPVEDKD
jgi:putative intracellular protease/amidase